MENCNTFILKLRSYIEIIKKERKPKKSQRSYVRKCD